MPEDKKHFDVAQPGQIPVSHTSRPVIVGQQDAPAGDPMMKAPDTEEARPVADHKVTLQPIHPDTKSEPSVATPESTPSTEELKAETPAGAEASTVQAVPPSENPDIQKLVADKTYKLPIKSPARKMVGYVTVVLVIVVIIAVVVSYLMMNR